MQHHRLQVFPFSGLASETLQIQDIHICLVTQPHLQQEFYSSLPI